MQMETIILSILIMSVSIKNVLLLNFNLTMRNQEMKKILLICFNNLGKRKGNPSKLTCLLNQQTDLLAKKEITSIYNQSLYLQISYQVIYQRLFKVFNMKALIEGEFYCSICSCLSEKKKVTCPENTLFDMRYIQLYAYCTFILNCSFSVTMYQP